MFSSKISVCKVIGNSVYVGENYAIFLRDSYKGHRKFFSFFFRFYNTCRLCNFFPLYGQMFFNIVKYL